jgi:hypothetical protein
MKKRLTYISPLKAGIVQAVICAVISLIAVPFIILAALFSHGGFGAVFAIFLPIIYGVGGFIAGIISALVYNLVAKWTGGLELVFTDVP